MAHVMPHQYLCVRVPSAATSAQQAFGAQGVSLEAYVFTFASDGYAELGPEASSGAGSAIWWAAGSFPDGAQPAMQYDVDNCTVVCDGGEALAQRALALGQQQGIATTIGNPPSDSTTVAEWLAPLLICLGAPACCPPMLASHMLFA